MQVHVEKNKPDHICFKYSHTDDDFLSIKLGKTRRTTAEDELMVPQPLYPSKPKISEGKYQDLMKLCSGPTPVISHPAHQNSLMNTKFK